MLTMEIMTRMTITMTITTDDKGDIQPQYQGTQQLRQNFRRDIWGLSSLGLLWHCMKTIGTPLIVKNADQFHF